MPHARKPKKHSLSLRTTDSIFDYESPRFCYRADLQFGRDGLVVVYPEIGVRR